MAQTTVSEVFTDAYIGFSNDGASWTDATGESNEISYSGGTRNTGEAYTADGDTAIVKAGKRTPLLVTINGLYTETADELYDDANDAYEGATDFYIRWAPAGGGSGDLGYTTSAGIVTEALYPMGEVSTGDPIPLTIIVKVASITESSIGTAGW